MGIQRQTLINFCNHAFHMPEKTGMKDRPMLRGPKTISVNRYITDIAFIPMNTTTDITEAMETVTEVIEPKAKTCSASISMLNRLMDSPNSLRARTSAASILIWRISQEMSFDLKELPMP